MKVLKIVVFLAALLPVAAQASDEELWDRELPFESATIEYAMDGMEKGSEALYIRNYGKVSAKHHSGITSMMGMKIENRTLEITDPDWVYRYDLKEGTGTKSTNPIKFMKAEYEKLTAAEREQVRENSEKLAVNFMQGGGGSIEKNVTEMFGYKVDKATVMGIESYTIHDTPIMLQTSGSMMGMTFNTKATSFKKGAVDDQFFQHPAGIQAVHDPQADNMSQMMAENIMAWLKDPEADQKAPPTPGLPAAQGTQGQPQQQPQGQDAATEKVIEGVFKSLFGN